MNIRDTARLGHPGKILPLIIFTVFIFHQEITVAQRYLNAEVRGTNCPISQKEAALWYFGQNAGIDFRSGDAVPSPSNWVMNTIQGSAIICDSLGNLLIFTDGMRVWDRTAQIMPNGDKLHGDGGVTMPAIIIPKPGNDTIYYIFTVDRPKTYPGDTAVYGLQVSEVSLALNGGNGDVTGMKNKSLLPEICEKISAVRHANGRDVWVVVHRWDSNEFCSFLVSNSGVDSMYVSSTVGVIHSGPISTNNSVGFMKISTDGSKLALAVHGSKLYEIFDFNSSTGKVTNAVPSQPKYSGAYGVEFSSDDRFLYTSTAFVGGLPDSISRLYQFDVTAGSNIFNTEIELAVNNTAEYFCGLQLGIDGRIYVARSPYGFDVVGVIYNPKRPGFECNFNLLNGSTSDFNLGGKRSKYGFPAFIQSYFDLPHFDVENICFTDTTALHLQNDANVTSVAWNFGDPASGSNTSTSMTPVHIFSNPGDYTVSVTENSIYTYSEQVHVDELPLVQLGDTVYMFKGSNLLLNAGEGFSSYEWNTGENTYFIKVSEPGSYWVIVQNDKCCFNIDSVFVILFNVFVPNAFNPGGVNNVFRAVPSSDQAINNFSMYIYNRWGQQVFQSKDISQGWDGRIGGQDAPGDVYVWLISYYVESEGSQQRVTYKGNVVLLR